MENTKHKAVAEERVKEKKKESLLSSVYVLEEYETTNETASNCRAKQ